jgi:hypothetical protein
MAKDLYNKTTKDEKYIIGWREWMSFPELKIDWIKAKVDTGARTSVLHAFQVNIFEDEGGKMVDFSIHPDQYSKERVIRCINFLHDIRWITDSGGHKELRPVIKTNIVAGKHTWQIEITLTNRDDMRFRFLLARAGVPEKFLIDPSSSYLFGKHPSENAT